MAWPTAQRNNLIAGLFLLGSIGLALFASFLLGGVSFQATNTYRVVFDLGTGAPGVEPGSPVAVGGLEAGTVTEVSFASTNGTVTGVAVTFDLDDAVTLTDDTVVYLEKPLLGALSSLNIPALGTGAAATDTTDLAGRGSPPAFLADAGFGSEQRGQLQRMLANGDEFSAALLLVSERWIREGDQITENVRAIAESMRDLSDRLTEQSPAWSEDITATLEQVRGFATELDTISASADARMGEVSELIASVQSAVDENRPVIDATLADARGTAAETRAAAGDARATIGEAQDLLARERATIRRILSHMLTASQQVALTAQEVRSEPWRVLFRPDTKELETQLLYDAARALTTASAQLSDAAAGLAAAGENASDEDRAAVEALREQLQTASEQLLERLSSAP